MSRYEIREIGTNRHFCVETKAKTLKGLKKACSWIGHGRFCLEGGNMVCTEITEELNEWLRNGI